MPVARAWSRAKKEDQIKSLTFAKVWLRERMRVLLEALLLVSFKCFSLSLL